MTDTNPETTTTTTPAKKVATKKAAVAKRAAAPAAAEQARERRSVNLPSLPEGFAYTSIAVTGPNGATITVEPDSGVDHKAGEFILAFEGAEVKRSHIYPDIKSAVQGILKAAKGIDNVVKREAAAAKAREAVFDL